VNITTIGDDEGIDHMTKMQEGIPGAHIGHGHLVVANLDRPKAEWKFDEDGLLEMINAPLDVDALVNEGRAMS